MQKQILAVFIAFCVVIFFCARVSAAPYAAMVMDARTGEVLHSRNANTPLHPASLTKMMTLYLAFQAVESGKLRLNQKVKVSKHAASEPSSKMYLKAGSRVSIRSLIRAAAIKSANDAATALGEAIAGSEKNFAKQMTRQARVLGMSRTTFKNAHGLTQSGHLSTARDMTILGLRLMYDFPDYYNLFSRQTTKAVGKTIRNTNWRLLKSYGGADGIKTGFTNAAGHNLVSSAQRGNKRIIATVFGGKSSARRNAQIKKLLNLGFSRASQRYDHLALPANPRSTRNGVEVASVIPVGSSAVMRRGIKPVYRAGSVTRGTAVALFAQEDVERQIIAAAHKTALEVQNYAPQTAGQSVVIKREEVFENGDWVITLGDYPTRFKAETIMVRTALTDLETLHADTHRISPKTVNGRRVYRVEFVGLGEVSAKRVCARLQARNEGCQSLRVDS